MTAYPSDRLTLSSLAQAPRPIVCSTANSAAISTTVNPFTQDQPDPITYDPKKPASKSFNVAQDPSFLSHTSRDDLTRGNMFANVAVSRL